MPNELHERLQSLTASIGFNDGANKGFWRIQPREQVGKDKGQWIEMGAELRLFYQNQRGEIASVPGRAVGSTGSPEGVRVLVQGQEENGVPGGIYGANTAHVRISEAVLPEGVLEEQGIENVPQLDGVDAASLPTLEQMERSDITDDDIRLINEGAASKEAKQQAKYRKSVEEKEKSAKPKAKKEKSEEKDSADEAVDEALADVAYNGDTEETVDSLIEKAKKPEAKKPEETPRKRIAVAGLEPGDVLRAPDGSEQTVVDIANVRVDVKNPDGTVAKGVLRNRVRLQLEDGTITSRDVNPDQMINVWGPKREVKKAKPPQKTKASETKEPTKEEQVPEAPTPEPTPAPAPSAPEPEAAEEDRSSLVEPENIAAPPPPPNFPPNDRVDDGSDIGMDRLTQEQFVAVRKKKATPILGPDGVPQRYIDEKGRVQVAQDPFSLMNALAEVYPNAKFTKDGLNLVLFRTKDKDGKIFELRASNANQKAISYSMRWTDPKTGEIEELFHYDTRDSIQALFTAANGPDGLMDKILGRNGFETLRNGQNWKRGPEATFRERARWFEQKKKMFTAEDMTSTLANGPATIYHTDDRNFGRVKKTGYASTWDIVKKIYDGAPVESVKDDFYLAVERIMSKVPTTDLAHKRVLVQLRKDAARLFGGLGNKDADKTVNALFTNASQKAKGKGFAREKDPGFRANPYASANGHTPLEVGMVVEYENNAGVVSIVRVNAKHVNFSVAAGKNNNIYDFGDFVQIIDSEGKTRTLSSKELRVLGNQNTPLTPYTPNPINDALTQYRISTGKIRPRGERQKPTVPGQIDAIADKRPEPEYTALVDDLIPGDDIYDENGVLLGEILDVQPTQDDDGNDGFAFLIADSDGDKISVFYPQGTAVNSLAEIPGATSAKEPTDTDPDETVFFRMMAEDTPLSSSINPVPDASSIDAPVGEPVEDTGGKKEVQETRTAVDKVLSVMLEAIKNGEVPWRKPFTDDPRLAGASLPRNPKTKHIYSGTNRMVLRFMADLKGYEDGRWMTYNQAAELGGQVRKGEKGTFILVPRIIPVKDKEGNVVLDDKGNKKTYVKFDAVAVFNVAQIDGLNLPEESKNTDLQAKTPLEAQEFVISRYLKSMEALGLDIPKIRYTYVGEYGSHATSPNWSPSSDVITLPTLEQFNSPEEIFDTLMHELAHSTGHPSRLDRTELTKDYGNPDGVARAKEELIAEISSALFQQMFGITSNLDNSAAYVQSWLKRLQNNPEEVINATKEAQKVVDYMLGTHLGDWSPVDGYSAKGA